MDRSGGKSSIGGSVCRDREGFTLLELIIVLVLIGLLLVVSIPALRNNLIDDPLKSTARKLIGAIDTIRDNAVREQQGYLLYIDLDENRLWQLREAEVKPGEVTPPETGVFTPGADVRLRDVWTRTTGTVSRGIAELWVSRQGYVDQTVIHLENGDGETLSLVVSSFLPGVEVRDGYYEPEQE